MKLYTIRHGQTDWNKERRFQGRSNVPLNDYGRRLADETAEGMKDISFDIIYSSPLDRALETAKIMQAGRDIPIIPDDRLIEMGFGVYEGLPAEKIHDVIEAFFNNPAAYEAPEGGESFDDVIGRAKDFINNVIVPLSVKKPEANVLISAHGALLRAIVVYLNHLDVSQFWTGPFQANCCVNIFDVNGHDIKMLEEAKVYYEQDAAEEDSWKKFAEK